MKILYLINSKKFVYWKPLDNYSMIESIFSFLKKDETNLLILCYVVTWKWIHFKFSIFKIHENAEDIIFNRKKIQIGKNKSLKS